MNLSTSSTNHNTTSTGNIWLDTVSPLAQAILNKGN